MAQLEFAKKSELCKLPVGNKIILHLWFDLKKIVFDNDILLVGLCVSTLLFSSLELKPGVVVSNVI